MGRLYDSVFFVPAAEGGGHEKHLERHSMTRGCTPVLKARAYYRLRRTTPMNGRPFLPDLGVFTTSGIARNNKTNDTVERAED
jgi:hypothetical protein